ncbi:MAPEG family protein [Colwelliaceae bacterium 6471]
MNPAQLLVLAFVTLVLLNFLVAIRMLKVRITEMRTRKIAPQKVALSAQRTERLQDSRASDNYNHLFELPVLFYALCLLAIATQHIPNWLPTLAFIFVISRIIHSLIQCTYNKVMHRFAVFLFGLFLLMGMWIGFALSYLSV